MHSPPGSCSCNKLQPNCITSATRCISLIEGGLSSLAYADTSARSNVQCLARQMAMGWVVLLLTQFISQLLAAFKTLFTRRWTGSHVHSECHQYRSKQQATRFASAFALHGYGYCQPASSSQSVHYSKTEFPQLQDITYLDHAATTLASKQQLQEAQSELLQHLLANPHSQLPAGLDHSAVAIEELRLLTLNMLNAPADEYEVVFTAGATAGLKLVGEAVPWGPDSTCAYLSINHNSVLGVRQQAAAAGAAVAAVTPEQLQHEGPGLAAEVPSCVSSRSPVCWDHGAACSVFIAPAECNMSGTRYNCVQLFERWKQRKLQQLQQDTGDMPSDGAVQQGQEQQQKWQQQQGQEQQQQQEQEQQQQRQRQQQGQEQEQRQHWLLLVDAAKACASHPPDCSGRDIDMLVLSYYKVFGHPTGLGTLVVRRSLLPLLQQHKAYFGGGTVEVALPDQPYVVRRSGPAGLEDGTLPFTAIAAARHGFKQLQRLGGFPCISRHTACLTWHLMQQLLQLQHSNGQPAAVLYCAPTVRQLLQQQQQQQQHASAQPPASTNSSTSSGSVGAGAAGKRGSSSGGSALDAALTVPDAGVMARFRELQGPVVCFNLVRPDGSWVGHKEVGKLAAIHRICLRTGCFCNPGACAHYLGLSSQDLLAHHAAGHVCWDDQDIMDGRPTGAVRASFGYMSSYEDVAVLLSFLERYFVNDSGSMVSTVDSSTSDAQARVKAAAGAGKAGMTAGVAAGGSGRAHTRLSSGSTARRVAAEHAVNGKMHDVISQESTTAALHAASIAVQAGAGAAAAAAVSSSGCTSPPAEVPAASAAGTVATPGRLTGLLLYPVKSCAAQQVSAWPIGPNGLLYDREWAVCGPDGQVLTQKRAPRLTQVRAEVDLQQQVLRLTATGMQQQLVVPLEPDGAPPTAQPPAAAMAANKLGRIGSSQQQQQEVRVCGDRVCAQVPVGHVVGVLTAAQEPSAPAAGATTTTAASPDAQAAMQQWFCEALGIPCRLVRQLNSSRTVKRQQQGLSSSTTQGGSPKQTLGFANEGQYLLVNQASIDYVADKLRAAGDSAAASGRGGVEPGPAAAVDALRFRPNLLVSGFKPWAEDTWAGIVINQPGSRSIGVADAAADSAADAAAAGITQNGSSKSSAASTSQPPVQPTAAAVQPRQHDPIPQQLRQQEEQQVPPPVCLQVVGACGRCDMVSVDQQTGQRQGNQLLSWLARERRAGGKLQFGVLLANAADAAQHRQQADDVKWLHVGDVVAPLLSNTQA